MSTLIKVNNDLTVNKLEESNHYILCQNVDNGEFIVWYKMSDNQGYVSGFYTFDLKEAKDCFDNRKFFESF